MSAARHLVQESRTIQNHLRDKENHVKLSPPRHTSRGDIQETPAVCWSPGTGLTCQCGGTSPRPGPGLGPRTTHPMSRGALPSVRIQPQLSWPSANHSPSLAPCSLTSSFVFAFHTCLQNRAQCSTLLSLAMLDSFHKLCRLRGVSRYKYLICYEDSSAQFSYLASEFCLAQSSIAFFCRLQQATRLVISQLSRLQRWLQAYEVRNEVVPPPVETKAPYELNQDK